MVSMNKPLSYLRDFRIQIIALSILFISAYYVPLRSMVNIWWENDDYSYGFLIPIAAAYLFWERRKTVSRTPVRSSWGIFPLLILFVLISLYGILGSSGNVSMPSVPILIILFTGFCFGVELLKRFLLPLGFLFFMVPVPSVIERYFGLYLKQISSKWGGSFISLFNIPVNVSGNIIDLGVTQLQVADACSGLRYIFPLLALGILYAYFYQKVFWKRLFCALVTIPMGTLMNAVRIGITGVLTEKIGPEAAQGFFHGFSGWIIFLVAFVLLFLIGRLLDVFPPKASAGKKSPVLKTGLASNVSSERKMTTGAFLVSVAMLCCVGALSLSTGALPALSIEGGMQGFPLRIGEWNGRHEVVDPAVVRASGAEDAFSGRFVNGDGEEIALYLGYRSTAFLANENFFHSPTVCLPSSGWVERDTKKITIPDVPYFVALDVTRMIIEKGGVRQLVYFWFQTKDEATYDKNINRFHLSLHAIRRDNTHDLFIRTVTPMNPLENIEDAEIRLDRFVHEMMPVLLQFLKEKQFRR